MMSDLEKSFVDHIRQLTDTAIASQDLRLHQLQSRVTRLEARLTAIASMRSSHPDSGENASYTIPADALDEALVACRVPLLNALSAALRRVGVEVRP